MVKKPNLFLVGLPKTGTSALHSILAEHPQIYMSPIKEPLYFSEDLAQESLTFHGRYSQRFKYKEESDYLTLFKNAKNEQIFGESTTSYIFSRKAPHNIYNFNPEAKILIGIREPIDFLRALHIQYLKEGVEVYSDFEQALSAEKERKEGRDIPKTVYYPSYLFYREKILYAKYIQDFMKYFNKNQIKIYVYEEFRSNNQKILKEILSFLQVQTKHIKYTRNVNPTELPRSQTVNKIILNSPIKHFLQNNLSIENYEFLKLLGKNLLLKQTKKPPVRKELIEELKKEFKDEVKRTGEIVGKNLEDLWGYNC